MRYYKHISHCLLTALITLLVGAFLFSGSALAESFMPTNEDVSHAVSGLFSKQSAILVTQSLIETKASELATQQEEAQKLLEQKESLAQYVASLRASVANLDDMFVHIDKYAFDAAGNMYTYGYCTWYVKTQRPDISNSWGNANTWYYMAQAQGWDVGYTPKKGAVATYSGGWLGHVAYVEKVSLDGQWVTISEMNYAGWNYVSYRTVYYTEFMYIYELN